MKRLKGMKQHKKMMLVLAVLMIGLMAGANHIGQATAAAAQESDEMDYLDPFTLTTMSFNDASTTASMTIEPDSSIGDTDVWEYAQPLKVWIPERPVFRSPCVPSWW